MNIKTKLTATALAWTGLITSAAGHGPQEGGGVMGFCRHESFCHGFADSFGHGLFGTGWIGFILVFGIWAYGVYSIIKHAQKQWAEKHESD